MKLLKLIIKSLDDTKLTDLKIYDTKEITPFFEFAIVATANNPRLLKAAVDHLKKDAIDGGFSVKGIEGADSEAWILVDLGQVIVNVFVEEERNRYDLDKLWRTLPQIGVDTLK